MKPCKLTECQGKPRCATCTAMDKAYGPPATPAEAEELAKKAVGDYLTACRMAQHDPVMMGNYLMKLASVTGCMMANAEGSGMAYNRLVGTATFVLQKMPKAPAALERIQ